MCKCKYIIDSRCGALVCYHRCVEHLPNPMPGEEYYRELIPMDEPSHFQELEAVLGPVPRGACALELGCGVSPYYVHLRNLGYMYTGIDTCQWARDEMRKRGAAVADKLPDQGSFDLLLAAHVLEHVNDAILTMVRMRCVAVPGAKFYIVVPEGTDHENRDHVYFFVEETLHRAVECAGMAVRRSAVKQIVPKERFIYTLAEVL